MDRQFSYLRSTLHPHSVALLSAQYWGTHVDAQATLLHSSRTQVYLVGDDKTGLVVKIHEPGTRRERLEAIIASLEASRPDLTCLPRHLANAGGCFVAGLEAPEGLLFATAQVFEAGNSICLSEPTASVLATELASLHHAFDGLATQPELRMKMNCDRIAFLARTLAEKASTAAAQGLAAGLAEYLCRRLAHEERAGIAWGMVHGDFTHNVLQNGQRLCFIDFEHMQTGSRLFEIAHLFWTLATPNPIRGLTSDGHPDQIWRSFSCTYQGATGLSCDDVPGLSLFWLLREVDIALLHEKYFGEISIGASFYDERVDVIADWNKYYGLGMRVS